MNLCHGYTLHRLWHDRVVLDVERQFVQDLGARPQHGVNQDDYEEGGGDNDYMDVDVSGEEGSIMGAIVVRQTSGADMDSAEMLDARNTGEMPFSSQGDLRGFYEEDEQGGEVDDFWKSAVVRWSPGLYTTLKPVLIMFLQCLTEATQRFILFRGMYVRLFRKYVCCLCRFG